MDAGIIVFLAEGESEESQESTLCLFPGLWCYYLTIYYFTLFSSLFSKQRHLKRTESEPYMLFDFFLWLTNDIGVSVPGLQTWVFELPPYKSSQIQEQDFFGG